MARFYGIGIGPGDSLLVTVRASQLLQEIDIIYTPEAKKGSQSFALQIASPYVSERVQIKQRHFPMVATTTQKQEQWQKVASEIVEDVTSGKNVGFITLGDPMVYSTYSYLLQLIGDAIETQTVPGITSFSSIASELGEPLTMDEESFAVVPATTSLEKIESSLLLHDTIVLMKVANHLDVILPLLRKYQLLENTFLVSKSSLDTKTIMRGIQDLTEDTKLSYFTTMIVKKNPLS